MNTEFIDTSINTYFTAMGGMDFLGLSFAIIIIIVIIMALIKPLDF